MNELTNSELNWLTTRGGRTPADVEVDEIGKYVIMSSYGSDVKVYIPSDFKLVIHTASAFHHRSSKGWKYKKHGKRKKKKLV